MGIMQIIDWCITFVIIFIFFMLARMFTFPDPDLSPAKLPPQQLMTPLWRAFITILLIIFKWIVVAITVIWIFWHILKLIPVIGPIIIAIVPPFRQLEQAGIFALWDELFVNIFTFNLFGIVLALLRFFNQSGQYIFTKVTGKSVQQRKTEIVNNISNITNIKITEESKDESKSKPKKQAPNDTKPGAMNTTKETKSKSPSKKLVQNETKPGTVDATQESKFTTSQHKAVEDKTQLCISEKTLPIYDSMTAIEKIQRRFTNNNISIACKAESVIDYTKMEQYS